MSRYFAGFLGRLSLPRVLLWGAVVLVVIPLAASMALAALVVRSDATEAAGKQAHLVVEQAAGQASDAARYRQGEATRLASSLSGVEVTDGDLSEALRVTNSFAALVVLSGDRVVASASMTGAPPGPVPSVVADATTTNEAVLLPYGSWPDLTAAEVTVIPLGEGLVLIAAADAESAQARVVTPTVASLEEFGWESVQVHLAPPVDQLPDDWQIRDGVLSATGVVYSETGGPLATVVLRAGTGTTLNSADAVTRTLLLLALVACISIVAVAGVGGRVLARPLRDAVRGLEAMASSDLTVRVKPDGFSEAQRVSYAVNRTADSLSSSVASVRARSVDVSESAHSLSGVSASLERTIDEVNERTSSAAAAATEMQAGLSQVAAAGEELNASFREISTHAARVAGVTADTTAMARTANEYVEELRTASLQIGAVSELISSIADQTNLLALNATIEAARAGSAGHGFAVVAEEVRALAGQTTAATSEIAQKVDAVQDKVVRAGEAVNDIAAAVTSSEESQLAIAGAVEEQTVIMQGVSVSLAELLHATNTIVASVEEAAASTEHADRGSEVVRLAAEELASLALGLRRAVEQFLTD